MGTKLDFDSLLNLAKHHGISEADFWKMTLGKLWEEIFPESTITTKDLEDFDNTILKTKKKKK